ncbi:MAG TPA: lactonase family protein, partial [Acidobacteriota bacterium]|nr:lactonase family protein [Acidobacteriota bacterium]
DVSENENMGSRYWVYIGTYTRDEARGIYRATFDPSTGSLSEVELAVETDSPAFLALHPDGNVLYSVNEVSQLQGEEGGGVSAFRINPSNGELTLLNQVSAKGAGPCHITVDPSGQTVLVANYGAGSVAAFPIQADGSLGAASSVIQHEGSSVHPRRQQGPHAHAVVMSPDGNYVFAADLGLDQILIYQLDSPNGRLTPADPPATNLAPGAGPRHFAFHTSGQFAYSINELDSTVTAFRHDTGKLETIQTISTLPDDFEGENYPSEIMIHPNGRFLYGSNRGHDSIVIYEISESDGLLTLVGHEPTRGPTPRYFGIEPAGSYLLSASQQEGTISVFEIDRDEGTLHFTGQTINVPTPVCLVFVEATS